MRGKVIQYSLNRRVMIMNLIPLAFLLAVLFIYLNVYQGNVESMAETTFHSLVDLKYQQVEKTLTRFAPLPRK